ncbi:MAG TPA: flagellar hook-basal body complex protein FliE [Clostridia bacterium]|nr:flagellar hook-basal body complex protein FliE [Clostridia bacterium]
MRIDAHSPIKPLSLPVQRNSGDGKQTEGFSQYLNEAVNKVNELQKAADNSAIALATGEIQNLHQVTIDSLKAEIALQFTLQIRNKVIEAYQEIMRMQI